MTSERTTAPQVRPIPTQVTISSPRPFFMQLGGQGPALSGSRVVWTATNGQGQTGSNADRIYLYDLQTRKMMAPVRTRFGRIGFIAGYVLAHDRLAYVDTGFAPGGIFIWRVDVMDLHTGRALLLAHSPLRTSSTIPPQIAFDGSRLLMLETENVGTMHHQSRALLFSGASIHPRVLQTVHDVSLGDPALANGAALWTVVEYGPRMSSRLEAYDTERHTLRTVPVGDVSQLAGSGDLVVWKSGMTSVGGHIGLYSLAGRRVVATDLARSATAIFPSIAGSLVSWTYADGSRAQIYSVRSRRVIYSAPTLPHRIYGLTSVSDHGVSWVYTVLLPGQSGRGYVVVRRIRS